MARLGDGWVLGFDLWPEGIAGLRRQAAALGLVHCTGAVADIAALPGVADGAADLALFGTVLHDLVPRGNAGTAVGEAARALRPGGWLAAVEFHPRDTRPGPSRAVRLAPLQLDALVVPHGFEPAGVTYLGASCYLALYRRVRGLFRADGANTLWTNRKTAPKCFWRLGIPGQTKRKSAIFKGSQVNMRGRSPWFPTPCHPRGFGVLYSLSTGCMAAEGEPCHTVQRIRGDEAFGGVVSHLAEHPLPDARSAVPGRRWDEGRAWGVFACHLLHQPATNISG